MSTKIQQLAKNKRIGRPRTVHTDKYGIVTFVLGPLAPRVEAYMQSAGCATRTEAIRDLIRIGLSASEMEY